MRTQAVMTRIARDVSLAVGDGTGSPDIDKGAGIRYDNIGPDISLCLRHDDPITPTPSDYGDDDWTCYFQSAPGGNKTLYLCNQPSATVPVTSMVECDGGGASTKILELDPGLASFYQVFPPAGRIQYIEIILETIYDHTLDMHSVSNPQYNLRTRVRPAGHSW